MDGLMEELRLEAAYRELDGFDFGSRKVLMEHDPEFDGDRVGILLAFGSDEGGGDFDVEGWFGVQFAPGTARAEAVWATADGVEIGNSGNRMT